MFIIVLTVLSILSIIGRSFVKTGSAAAFYLKTAATISAFIAVVFFFSDIVFYDNVREDQRYDVLTFSQAVQTEEPCVSFIRNDDNIPTFFYFHNANNRGISEIEIGTIKLESELKAVKTNLSNKFDFWFLGLGGENVTYTLYVPIE